MKITALWDRFWFTPQSPTPLSLYRILLGLLILQSYLIQTGPQWLFYYGENGSLPIETVVTWWKQAPYFDALFLIPGGDNAAWAAFWVLILACLSLIFGFYTRASAAIVFLLMLSLDRHFPFNLNGGDCYMRAMLSVLMVSNSGDAFSVDSLIKAARQDYRQVGCAPPLKPQWALRLMQVQMAAVYCANTFYKGQGSQWLTGTACYYATRLDDFLKFDVPVVLHTYAGLMLLTYFTLVIETSLWTLVWFRPFRYWVLFLGFCLHAGIDWCLNLPVFEWAFITSYVLWFYPSDLRKMADRINAFVRRKYGAPYKVFYDGACIFCVRCAGLIVRVDVFKRFEMEDFRTSEALKNLPEFDSARAEKEMLVMTKNGMLGGFDAFRFMSRRLPLLFLAYLFMSLPGMSYLGHRLYKFISARRYLILGGNCVDNSCQIKK